MRVQGKYNRLLMIMTSEFSTPPALWEGREHMGNMVHTRVTYCAPCPRNSPRCILCVPRVFAISLTARYNSKSKPALAISANRIEPQINGKTTVLELPMTQNPNPGVSPYRNVISHLDSRVRWTSEIHPPFISVDQADRTNDKKTHLLIKFF